MARRRPQTPQRRQQRLARVVAVVVGCALVGVAVLLMGRLDIRQAVRTGPSVAVPRPSPTASSSLSSSPSSSPSAMAGPSGSPVLAAVGDIACDPTSSDFASARGTATNCRQKATSDLVVTRGADAVALLGDSQYESGTLQAFHSSYELSWGRLKSMTRPAVGNHEYRTPGAAGYFDYFGAAAGERSKGYYSYDLGAWHVVVLNTNCAEAGGCGSSSPQARWLRADLAAHPSACTLAYGHHPRWSSGKHGDHASIAALYQALYDARGELLLSGHDHDYERFVERAPDGAPAPGRGVRQFVVGTGGKSHYAMTPGTFTEASSPDTYGVLFLTLAPTSYRWVFVPEAGATYTDAGSAACR